MASNFIIDPASISFSESKANIETWLDTRPDALKWEDFFAASAGQTIIELLAGVSTFTAYQVITGRREAYLTYAENRSSAVAIANQLGYSVFRGANARVKLKINPPITKTYQKYEVIGSVLDYDLIVRETTIANAGVETEVECVIGFVKTESLTVNSNVLQSFRFTSSNVSEDFRLYLDGTELFPTTSLVDLINDEFVTLSNATGAFDLFYLNKGTLQYVTGSIYDLEYLELVNPEFTLTDVASNETGITSVEISKVYEEEEATREIKINAPLYNETKFVIKGRNDYEKIFTALSTDILSSSGRDYSPAVVQLSYVRENLNMFTETEKDAFQVELLKARPFGVQPTIITDPVQNNLALTVTVYLNENTNEDVLGLVDGILSSQEKLMGKTLDLFYIENQIERESYVKTARVVVDAPYWAADTFYQGTEFIQDPANNDILFSFAGHIRKSDALEPVWPTVVGDKITDGEIIWECREDYRQNFPQWSATTEYSEDDIVIPTILNGYVYVAVATVNFSGLVEPSWPATLVETVDDNEIVWRVVNLVGAPAAWQAGTAYALGDIVVGTGGGTYAYQAVKYRSASSSVAPAWNYTPGFTTNDGKARWLARDLNKNTIEQNWNEYFLISKSVNVTLQIIL
jgi:hypothetical protein